MEKRCSYGLVTYLMSSYTLNDCDLCCSSWWCTTVFTTKFTGERVRFSGHVNVDDMFLFYLT